MPEGFVDLQSDESTFASTLGWVYSSTEYYRRESSLLAIWVALGIAVFVLIFCLCVLLFVYLGWGWWCCADREDWS